MNIELQHPGALSLQTVLSAAETKQTIRRSPHVGNLSPAELICILGVARLGGDVQLEMVDTIHGGDNYAKPRLIFKEEQEIPLLSQKKAKNRVVGSCMVSSEHPDAQGHEGLSILDVHMAKLKDIMPRAVNMELSSEYFASIGGEVLAVILGISQSQVTRPLRRVQPDGRITLHEHTSVEDDDIFGLGENILEGILPPLEAMMVIEVLKVAIDARGTDSGIIHIAGPDMIKYTKDAAVMNTVSSIAAQSAAELGIPVTTNVTYILPCMAELNRHPDLPGVVSADVVSHHDLPAIKEEVQ